MATYRELLAQVKDEIDEVPASDVLERLDDADRPLLLDVREQDEWQEGHLPGAIHVERGNLESRVEAVIPDRAREIVIYCAAGARSAFAAKSLTELGYTNVSSMIGGFTDWKRNGYAFTTPRVLTPAQRARYSRHILIPEVGEEGQQKLLDARVLLIGAGGLGSPSSLYLAAAGVGTLGIVDADIVDDSNLQRQIVHSTNTLGEPKVLSAKRALEALNPDVNVITYEERLTSENVERILADGWDVIVDGADNFPTRYLVNDASVWHDIPVVHGSIYRFEGQVTVFHPHVGPCYRCLYPAPPPPELAPSCAEGGVLGVLPGIVGSLQASEALKLIIGAGETLTGRLLLFDALHTTFDEVTVKKDPGCPVCGDSPSITEYIDYVEFCAGPGARMTAVRIPPTLRAEVGGERQVEADGDTVRGRARGSRRALSGARHADLQRRRDRNVRQRLPRRRGRAHARRPRDGRRDGPDGDPAAGDGRWLDAAALAAGRLLAARPDRQHAARRADEDLAEAVRQDLREARGPEPDRLDQGSRRQVDDRGGRGIGRARARPRTCSSRRPATRATRWR